MQAHGALVQLQVAECSRVVLICLQEAVRRRQDVKSRGAVRACMCVLRFVSLSVLSEGVVLPQLALFCFFLFSKCFAPNQTLPLTMT